MPECCDSQGPAIAATWKAGLEREDQNYDMCSGVDPESCEGETACCQCRKAGCGPLPKKFTGKLDGASIARVFGTHQGLSPGSWGRCV